MFLWLAGAALFLTIFIASNTFAGAKSGYVFKKDELGIGYYLDYK